MGSERVRKRTLALVAVVGLVLVALLTWSASLRSGESPTAVEHVPAPIELDEVGDAVGQPGLTLAPVVESSESTFVSEPVSEPVSAPRSSAAEAEDGSLARFKVTGGPDGRPLPGVKVYAGREHLVGSSMIGDTPSVRAFKSDPVGIAIERLPVHETDEQGIVRVPVWAAEGIVAAVSIPATETDPVLEAWIHPNGTQLQRAHGKPFPLRLHARQEWTVRAIDSLGRGRAEVQIMAQLLRPRDLEALDKEGEPKGFPAFIGGRAPTTKTLGTTGAGGRLTYTGSPLIEARSDGDSVVAVLLAAVLPGGEQIPVLVREIKPAPTVIDLPMQPSVEMTARLLEHNGTPLKGWHKVLVKKRTENGSADLKQVFASDGEAKIGSLPANSSMRVEIGPQHGPGVDVVSPQTSGERVSVELRAGPEHAILVGRMIDSRGRPLVNYRVAVQIGGQIGARDRGRRALCEGTDRGGRFSALVPLAQDPGRAQTIVLHAEGVATETETTERATQDEDADLRLEYRVRLDTPLEAATRDLGTLSPSAPLPLLVAGRVVPSKEAGCDNYDLVVEARGADGDWYELPGIEASRPSANDFLIHGDSEPAAVHRLVVRAHNNCPQAPDPIAFTPGTADLRVEFRAGSALTVRVASPLTAGSSVSLSKVLDFVLEGVAGEAAQMTREELVLGGFGNVDDDGLTSLHWKGLRTGTYRLQVSARGTETVLGTMPNIVVAESLSAAPSVLDLSGALFPFRLNIVGPEGQALTDARVSLRWAPDANLGAVNVRGANASGFAPQVPVELTVRAKGHLTARQPLNEGVQQIVMQAVTLATTQIEVTGLDLPADVRAELVWGPADLARDFQEPSYFAAHEGTLRAMDELRIGKSAVDDSLSVAVQQPTRPGPSGGLRLFLVLSAPPTPAEPGLPTKRFLDEMSGWVLPNPQALSAILPVDKESLRAALAAMGRQ